MASIRMRDTLLSCLYFVLGLILVYSSLGKFERPTAFLENVYEYRLVGAQLGRWIAIIIPATELVLGGCLLLRTHEHGALAATTALFSVFVTAQISVIMRGLIIPCGCFGSEVGQGEIVGTATLFRTSTLLLLSLGLYFWSYLAERIRYAAGLPR